MRWRLGILKEHGLGLKEIQETIVLCLLHHIRIAFIGKIIFKNILADAAVCRPQQYLCFAGKEAVAHFLCNLHTLFAGSPYRLQLCYDHPCPCVGIIVDVAQIAVLTQVALHIGQLIAHDKSLIHLTVIHVDECGKLYELYMLLPVQTDGLFIQASQDVVHIVIRILK